MKKSSRPRSAGSHTKLPHAAEGGGAKGMNSVHRDKAREGVQSAPGRARSRPRSAQPRPAYNAPVPQDSLFSKLQQECLELKRMANSLIDDNAKSRTRLMVLERELQRRERLLRQIVQTKKAGQGIDMDILLKLREERNMLGIFRQKAQDLNGQVAKKDAEIRRLKREPQFTRIIELQVEYATWQHEAKRLQSLLQEPSPEVNDAAKQEIEVHEKRAERLRFALTAEQDRRDKIAADLEELEADHGDLLQQYQSKERELQEQQALTRDLALSFKEVLQERKQVEQLQEEIEEMELQKRRYDEELQSAESDMAWASKALQQMLPSNAVSGLALQHGGAESSAATAASLHAMRQAAAACTGERTLLQELRARDLDADGLLSLSELTDALGAIGYSDSRGDLATVHSHFAERADGEQRIRWLDFLLTLDRLGGSQGVAATAAQPLPNMRRLRAACLRAGVIAEELQRGLEAVSSPSKAQEFFDEIGLGAGAAEWCAAWQALGSDGLLLRLPLSDVTMTKASHVGWLARCTLAVHLHQEDLIKLFGVGPSQDMQLTEDQFRMVCNDVLALELSEDDVDDLGLFASNTKSGLVDGQAVLRLADQRAASSSLDTF